MRTRRCTAAWLLFLIFLVPALAFGQGHGRLVGKIVDTAGKPVDGVVVTATCKQLPKFRETTKTDKKGTFIIDFDDLNVTYHYRFDKPGYAPLDVDQTWQLEGTQHFEWTLQPAAVSVPGGPAPASMSAPAVIAFNAGVSAVNLKDYATAETKFKDAVQQDPKLARGWAALATVEVQLGHSQDAVDAAEKAMSLGLKDETLLSARWQGYRNLKDDAKTAAALKDLEAFGKQTEEAKKIHNEAVVLMKAGDNAAAFARFQEALKVDPDLQPALLGLANSGIAIGKFAEAAAATETVLKNDPANAQALRLRYNACLKLGDKNRLFDALAGLTAVEPAVATKGMLALAFESYDANDASTAKARFTKVLAADPSQPLAHYYLGMLFLNEGAAGDARSHLEKFIELAPSSAEAATAREVLKQLAK